MVRTKHGSCTAPSSSTNYPTNRAYYTGFTTCHRLLYTVRNYYHSNAALQYTRTILSCIIGLILFCAQKLLNVKTVKDNIVSLLKPIYNMHCKECIDASCIIISIKKYADSFDGILIPPWIHRIRELTGIDRLPNDIYPLGIVHAPLYVVPRSPLLYMETEEIA